MGASWGPKVEDHVQSATRVTVTVRSQIASVQAEFESRPAGLRAHVERVLVEALDLANRYDVDPDRVELAVWGHDLFRAHRTGELLSLAASCGVPIGPEDALEPVLLHGPIAAAVLRDRFSINDDEALAAVRDHTLGLGAMPIIAKIILIADKVEQRKRRRSPAMRAIRRVARVDLDLALLCWADWKWVEERTQGWNSHPTHWAARSTWVREHHFEIGMPGRSIGDD